MSFSDIDQRLGLKAETIGVVAFGLAVILLLGQITFSLPGWTLVLLESVILFLLYSLLVLGLNLQYGFTGIINFGHVIFFLIGGYTTALLIAENPIIGIGLGLPWPVGVVGAIVAALLFSVVIGLATLRLRGDFLALVTLAAVEVGLDMTTGLYDITGGNEGIGNIPRPLFRWTSNADAGMIVTTLILTMLVALSYAAFRRLTTAPYGRVLLAIRSDEIVANALGKNAFRRKMEVLIYGSIMAGLAGSMLVMFNGGAAPGFFGITVTLTLWIGMLMGGAGSLLGALGGLAIILGLRLGSRFMIDIVPVTQTQFGSVRLMLIGFILILIIRYRPYGIWGDPQRLQE